MPFGTHERAPTPHNHRTPFSYCHAYDPGATHHLGPIFGHPQSRECAADGRGFRTTIETVPTPQSPFSLAPFDLQAAFNTRSARVWGRFHSDAERRLPTGAGSAPTGADSGLSCSAVPVVSGGGGPVGGTALSGANT